MDCSVAKNFNTIVSIVDTARKKETACCDRVFTR